MNAPLAAAKPRRRASNCPTRDCDNLRKTDRVVVSPALLLGFFEEEILAALNHQDITEERVNG